MKNINNNETDTNFPVVGIGASAGGLDAFKQFLKALPSNSGMAFVFVQHLSPGHVSLLPEILAKVSPIPVEQIKDNMHLEKDHLYIIPENKIVTALDGVLKLTSPPAKFKKNNTIDLFFSSLGAVHQSYAVGVVLSGALNDGTVGLQVIKSYGGITFAQDAASAGFESMPNSAVKNGVVDFVMPPQDIAAHLISINRPFHENNQEDKKIDPQVREDDDVFKQILTVLRVRRGVDFQYYKSSTLKRRILRRMALSKFDKPSDYLYALRENKSEQDALYNDMLISVTSFFRDSKTFNTVCNQLFPELIRTKTANEPLRIWIAGCATGEEAYTMAICLQELLGDKAAAMKIQIFATDISENAIAKARTGIYRVNELEGLSTSRLQQFFTKLDGSYQVNKTIRDMCVFAHHNLLKDPPFSKIDLVSCRNVMIYLEPVLQKKALTTFHYALKESGFLLLGKSETIGNNTDIFSAYESGEKIYKRKGPIGRFMNVASTDREKSFTEVDKGFRKEETAKDVFKAADELVLLHFMPASVLVNEKFDIVQFRGATEMWLVPPPGKPSFNVLKMARDGLAFELRNLLHQAKKSNLIVKKYNIFFKINQLQYFVNIHIMPVPNVEPHFLIIFQPTSANGISPNIFELEQPIEHLNYNAGEMRIEQLERELIQARADMRVISEEQESANEELQSANEELLSGSEELQSLNEELETSKEELQSTNEEIIIVNKELLDRNNQLNNARLYTEGIVNTIRDPLIVLDKTFRIKRATDGFYKKFKLKEQETEGQPFFELSNKQWNIPELHDLLENELPYKKVSDDVEITTSFPDIGLRILCINMRQLDYENNEPSILLSIEDITDRRKVENGLAEVERLLQESKERLRSAIESTGLGTWDFDPVTQTLIWDKRCRELFGISESDAIDLHKFLNLIHEDDREKTRVLITETMQGKNGGELETEYRTLETNENYKWLKASGKAFFNDKKEANRLVGTVMDITVSKTLNEATIELLKKKDEFISIASHELKTPITTLKTALQLIEKISKEKDEFEPIHRFVEKASNQVNKLTQLVTDLLDVTKIHSGKLELSKTHFSLEEMINNCIDDFSDLSRTHQLIFESKESQIIYADQRRLEQVVNNLVSNALKYSPELAPVHIQMHRSENAVRVTVTDQGIGIAKDYLPHVFDRFYRIEESAKNISGLGLGLFISSEIIKQHQGEIGVTSEPGKGSSFWFKIPVS
jgi:two-component system CheB/CheR fusion protein